MGEIGECAGAVGDGCGIEAVEFVEGVVDGCVGYEVVYVFCVFGVYCSLGFVGEGGGAGEGVVGCADYV